MAAGAPNQENISFVSKKHSIDELLVHLRSVRALTCDEDLEEYLLKKVESQQNPLVSLQSINNVPIKVLNRAERAVEKQVRRIMNDIWRYVGTYRLVTEEQMDEESIWYVMDEVGCSMTHSDVPNIAVHPFIYSPNGKLDDHTITYSICWPTVDLEEEDVIFRDYLAGIDEKKFRSSRLTVWCETPDEYFQQQLALYKTIKPKKDSAVEHLRI
mmetsp:Transcript_5503/g.5024  ORF Transcript_5503/g.5024 Transcript_5503/m.5024 type:complete len:213 (+) Transcript_5503:352-990(+)